MSLVLSCLKLASKDAHEKSYDPEIQLRKFHRLKIHFAQSLPYHLQIAFKLKHLNLIKENKNIRKL